MCDVGTASLTNEILFIRATNGRPYVILSFCRPSVNCVDSSLQGEPKKPLLEERWHEVTECWYFYHPLTKPPIFHIILIYKKKGMIFMEYNRANAVAYAKKWAYGRNPKYYDFSDLGGDCTNFASQCIYAGSGVMNYTPTYGWYYISVNNRAPAWTGVDELYRFLTTNRGAGPRAILTDLSQIQNGDIIQLQFTDKERFDHSPVVVDAGNRTPQSILVAAHSYDADCRPLSSYRYIKIRPLHITNVGE